MQKILVSPCLLGYKVRYDGKDQYQPHAGLQDLLKQGRVIIICPEMAGGLPVPRPPSEIEAGYTSKDILLQKAKVITNNGNDMTLEYISGAKHALELVKKYNIKVAILKANSPSCGSRKIYDGTFSGRLIEGSGVTAELLFQNGIQVFDETQIDDAIRALGQLNNDYL